MVEREFGEDVFLPAVEDTFAQALLYFETEFDPESDSGACITHKSEGMETDRLLIEGYVEGRGGLEIIPSTLASELEIPVKRCLELLEESPLARRVTGPYKSIRFVSTAPVLEPTPAGLEAAEMQERQLAEGDFLGEYWETLAERSLEVRQRRQQKFSSFFRF